MGGGVNNHRNNHRAKKLRAGAGSRSNSMRTVQITIPSDVSEGRKAKDKILALLDSTGYDADSVFAIRLALEEAIQNAIKHGNRYDTSKKVHIEAKVSSKQAEIVIEDEGGGFVRDCVPDPRNEENLEKCSGRGVFLIESFMNRVKWSHGGRRVRMVRKNADNSGTGKSTLPTPQDNGPHPR